MHRRLVRLRHVNQPETLPTRERGSRGETSDCDSRVTRSDAFWWICLQDLRRRPHTHTHIHQERKLAAFIRRASARAAFLWMAKFRCRRLEPQSEREPAVPKSQEGRCAGGSVLGCGGGEREQNFHGKQWKAAPQSALGFCVCESFALDHARPALNCADITADDVPASGYSLCERSKTTIGGAVAGLDYGRDTTISCTGC